jgi:hypothetical protein
MIAYHGDKKIKAKYLKRVRAHAKADRLIQGTGWENGKGCAVGCTLEAYDHARYPIELGVPEVLARLEDALFECLSHDVAMTWPTRFLKAIPVGAELSKVWGQWAVWMLTDPTHGVLQYATGNSAKAIQDVADLYRIGGTPRQFAAAAAGAAAGAGAAQPS